MALLIYSYACRAVLRMDIGIAPRVHGSLHGSYIDILMLGYTRSYPCLAILMLGYTHARLYSLLLLGTNTKNSP